VRRQGLFFDARMNRILERPIDSQDIRVERDEDGWGAGLILVAGGRTEIELSHAHDKLHHIDPDAPPGEPTTIGDRLDRSEDRDRLELRYAILGRTRLTLATTVGTIDFVSPLADGSDSDDWSVLPGVLFGEGGVVSGSVRLGWGHIDAEDPDQLEFDDAVGRIELAYRPNRHTAFHLTGLREPGFSASSDSVYFLNASLGARAVRYFNRLVGVEAGGSRGRLTFPGSTAPVERVDDLDSYEAGLRLRVSENEAGRRVEYSLRYRHSRVVSTDPTQDQTRSTLGLGAVLGF
jgi:hypothetical protein